jgi:hypothetical protein
MSDREVSASDQQCLADAHNLIDIPMHAKAHNHLVKCNWDDDALQT